MMRFVSILAFGCSLGYFAQQVFSPDLDHSYEVRSQNVLRSPEPTSHLYLRHTFFAPERPLHGWLQILSPDGFRLFVNGQVMAESEHAGFVAVSIQELTPFLRTGQNVIAIVSETTQVGQRGVGMPRISQHRMVAVEGGYVVGSQRHSLGADQTWRCADRLQRDLHWWFETEFDDSSWGVPEVVPKTLQAEVPFPPDAVREPCRGDWIEPSGLQGQAVFQRRFRLPEQATAGWLRLCAETSYRLAVNGYVVDVQESPLSLSGPEAAFCRVYDLRAYLRAGPNDVTVALTDPSRPARLMADIEVRTSTSVQIFASDETWSSRMGLPTNWMRDVEIAAAEPPSCRVQQNRQRIPPWQVKHEVMETTFPLPLMLRQLARQVAWSLAFMSLAWLASWIVVEKGSHVLSKVQRSRMFVAVLAPPTILGVLALICSYDPRLARHDIFELRWLIVLISIAPFLWLAGVVGLPQSSAPRFQRAVRHAFPCLAAFAIVLCGCWLRYNEVDRKPIQHDEASAYRSTQGYFDRGFPSRQIHPDMPAKLVETSELVYLFDILADFVYRDPRYVVRVPSVAFGTLTICLLLIVGSRVAGNDAGLIAAAIYAFSPIAIEMSSFGRYFAQLQFFTLLTAYCFWQTIRRQATINPRALAATTVSFLAMYFTWQGSALVSVGMIAGCLIHRRRSIGELLSRPAVWSALLLVAGVLALHISFRSMHLLQFLSYGTGISNLSLEPMWKYGDFQLLYYVWESSWNRDLLLPMIGLIGACLAAIDGRCAQVTRYFLLTYLTTAVFQAALLPIYTWRYAYHLSPILILLASLVLSRCLRGFGTMTSFSPMGFPRQSGWMRLSGVTVATTVVALGCGATVQLTELKAGHIPSYSLPDLMFADLAGATRFVMKHASEEDVVLASNPHVVDHFMGIGGADYWPQSRLYTQALLDDFRSIPLHRIAGTKMLATLEDWAELFANHPRVWYVLVPSRHDSQNTAAVSRFVRENMEVAYQGYRVLVLVRADQNRPALIRRRQDLRLQDQNANLIGEY